MKRAIAMALIASTLLAGLAKAADAPARPRGGEGDQELSARSIDAPYLAVPVVRDGQLVNYLFVSVRIEIASGVDPWRTRERAHFLCDALVRASHTSDLADPNNDNLLNEARALEVYRAVAAATLGERAVAGVSIIASHSRQGARV